MKITFVGTGSGKTSLKRFHSSILISSNNHNLLIDAGDGTAKALLGLGINFNNIDSILFTHYHADHFGGVASLFTQMKLNGRTKPLTFITHKLLVKHLIDFLNSTYMFFEIAGFEVKITGFEFGKVYRVSEFINFIPKQNNHIKQKEELKNKNVPFLSSSFYFEVEKKKIVYTSDIGNEKDLYLFEKIKTDIFITETTHVELNDIFTAFQILKPNEVYLTHIDDEDEKIIADWIDNLNNNSKFVLAKDGMVLKL